MATKKQYEHAKKSYLYMCKKYGIPNDLTGGYVEGDKYYKLLKNPTFSNAYNDYVALIQYGFQMGEYIWWSDNEIDLSNNLIVVEIYNEYC